MVIQDLVEYLRLYIVDFSFLVRVSSLSVPSSTMKTASHISGSCRKLDIRTKICLLASSSKNVNIFLAVFNILFLKTYQSDILI